MNRRALAAGALAAGDGVGTALAALAANRVRALLTVMGIVLGVATVMSMAAVVTGVRTTVMEGLEVMGPESFVVERMDVAALASGMDDQQWARRPRVTLAEAEMIAALPGIRSATPAVTATAQMRADTRVLDDVDVEGLGAAWDSYRPGTFVAGRSFLPAEVAHSAGVVILSDRLARSLVGREDAVGAEVRLDGHPFEVVGVFRAKPNIFSDNEAGWAVVPYGTALRQLRADADWVQVQVVPAAGTTQGQAMNTVTAALREARGLRPLQASDFALTRQEEFRALFDRTTAVFVAVLFLLASAGLGVGGIGVVAIMTISVTERTREIGIRKALGATRRAIVWQFLVEAVTLTVAGGAAGVALAAVGVFLLARYTPVPASIPLWSAGVALGVITAAGVVFGLYPAGRAARLDPVVALRDE